jgi:hypothetical protein
MSGLDHRLQFSLKLAHLLARTRLRVAVHGSARVLAVGGPMVLLAAWSAGAPFGPGGFLAGGLVFSLLAGLVALLWNQVLAPLLRLRRAQDFVRGIESDGDFANVLVAGEEGLRLPERWAGDDPVRTELRGRLYRHGVKVLDFLTPEQVVRIRYSRLSTVGTAIFLLTALVLTVVSPETMSRGLSRLVNPWPTVEPAPTRGLYPAGGADFVVAGQDLELGVVDFGGGQERAVCEIRVGQGLWQPLDTVFQPVDRGGAFLPAPYRQWSAVAVNVREDFSWRFRRGTLVSSTRQVQVRHYPLLTELAGRVVPPAYTGVPAQEMPRLPSWFEVPAGSRLNLLGQVNHALRRAVLVTSVGDSVPMELDGTLVSGALTADTTQSFFLVLEDSFGLSNQAPLEFAVAALADAAPLVNLDRPDDDGVFPLDGSLHLVTDAADDYGLTSLLLQTRVLPVAGAENQVAQADIPWDEGKFWDPDYLEEGGWVTAAGPVSLTSRSPREGRSALRVGLDLQVDLSRLELVAGDVLELRVAAVDNRRPGKGQRGNSRALRLVLPSAADMLSAQAEASEERRGELEEMRRRGLELGADLDRLNRELMKNPLPDWARQQEMEDAIQRQKTMQEELARLSRELQQDLDRLAAGQMTSQTLMDKAEEVSQLLSQPPGESLNDLLARMDQAGEQVDPAEVAQAIREVAKNQKDMARRLDAALAMLKRMEREQDMEGLASLLEQMIRKQQELADLSRELAEKEAAGQENEGQSQGDQQEGDQQEGEQQDGDQQDGQQQSGEQQDGQQQSDQEQTPSAEELARRQEALAEELQQLKEKLEEALAALEEEKAAGDESASAQKMEQALKEAMENLEQQMKKGDMGKASEQLSEMDPSQAAELQQQALRDLGSLYHVLLESQQAMEMAMQQNQVSSLRQLAADMLAVSTRQEEIAARIPPQLRDVRSLEMTRSQHRLQKATTGVRDRLSLLLDESPMRIMKLLGKLDTLIEQMGFVVQAMEENRGPVARRDALSSLAEANRLVIGLLTEAQITSQSSSGGTGDPQQSMAQQLQKMAQEQAKLNGMTQQLRDMLANRGLSQETRAQMQRLGEAQGSLGGKLNDLEEKERANPEGERLLGDLGELGQQMERISGELDDGLVSEETLIRQERILSRLLDARNSVRRRDYTTRRESRTATRLFGDMEGGAGADGSQDADGPFRLRYQALEKAPLEYRDLVRRYFTALDSLRRLDDEPWIGPGDEPGQGEVP